MLAIMRELLFFFQHFNDLDTCQKFIEYLYKGLRVAYKFCRILVYHKKKEFGF